MKIITSHIMKKIIFLLFLFISHYTIYAQTRNQDDNVKILFLDEYPYTNVLDYLNNPDTILFCHYIPRRYGEKDAPFAISLFIYRNNNEWWSTTLSAYLLGKRKHYWELTKPMWIQTNITSEMTSAIAELDSVYYNYDISINHTWIYVKYGHIITKDLIGNIHDFADIVPKFTYVFMVGLLESYNHNVIKTFKK